MDIQRRIGRTGVILLGLLVTGPANAKGGGGGGGGHAPSPNDQRSNSLNPNNSAYQSSMDNRSNQLNPEHDAYWSSRGLNRPAGGAGDADEDDDEPGFAPEPPTGTGSPDPAWAPPSGSSVRPRVVISQAPPAPTPPFSWLRFFGKIGLGLLGVFAAIYLSMVAFVRSRRPY